MAFADPYLMFLGDAPDQLAAKTAQGVAYWRPEKCTGQFRMTGCQADLGLTDMSIAEAAEAGCRTVIVGVANRGGVISESWTDALVDALEHGMDVASGLHNRLRDVDRLRETAERQGRQLLDVRHPTRGFGVGKGSNRSGKRVLTVGTDCSVGKMYTSLALEAEMHKRGMDADFRATGQTGILIEGTGVSVDAVVADFISGAAEWLSPEAHPDHWDVVEGQGSLFHASFAGVSTGLLHGSQPDALVLCHEPTRAHMRGLPDFPLPDLRTCMVRNEKTAHLTNPYARTIGVAVNTAAMSMDAARDYLQSVEAELDLPTVDPVRDGVAPLVDALERM
jgi:uncharacterized NAD-dependent epimerase/dehydratase family protein